MTKRIKLFAIMFSIILVVALVGSIGATAAIWAEGSGGGQDNRGTAVAIDEWNAWAKYFSSVKVGDGIYITGFQSIDEKVTVNTDIGFNSTILVIPRTTTDGTVIGITGNAFSNTVLKEMIEEIRIPNTVTKICANAFSGFVNLKKVIFEDKSSCEIEDFAFAATIKLEAIYIGNAQIALTKEAGTNKYVSGNLKFGANAFFGSQFKPE